MRRYPGISELGRRDRAYIASVFVTVPMIALCVLAYLPGPTPVGAWIAIGLLASIDAVLAGILLLPRTYLVIDAARGLATFVDRGERSEIPISEIAPLYVRKIEWRSGQDRGATTLRWYRVETAAAPVIFYRGTDEKGAKRRLKRLNQKLGFSVTGPTRTEYAPARESD
jgi:hypothetical protein